MHSARPFFPLSVVMCAHLLVPFARFYTLFQYRTSSRKKEGLLCVFSLSLGKNDEPFEPVPHRKRGILALPPQKGGADLVQQLLRQAAAQQRQQRQPQHVADHRLAQRNPYVKSPAISVASDPKTMSRMPAPPIRLAIRHPTNSPGTASGMSRGRIVNASLMRNCTSP